MIQGQVGGQMGHGENQATLPSLGTGDDLQLLRGGSILTWPRTLAFNPDLGSSKMQDD